MSAILTPVAGHPATGRRRVAVARARLEDIGRVGVVGGLAGATALGLGSRLAMRIVALANGEPTELTLGGTAFLLLAGTISGAAVVVLTIGVLGRWLPTGRPRSAAVLALSAMLPAMAFLDPGNVDFVLFGPRWLTVGLFTLVPVLFGGTVAGLLTRSTRWGRRRSTRVLLVAAGVAATGGAVAMVVGVVGGIVALLPLPLAVLAAIVVGPTWDGGRFAPVGRALTATLAAGAAATLAWRAVAVAVA